MHIKPYTKLEEARNLSKELLKAKANQQLEESFGFTNITALLEHSTFSLLVEDEVFDQQTACVAFDSSHPFLTHNALQTLKEKGELDTSLSVFAFSLFPF